MEERAGWIEKKLGELILEVKPGYPSGEHNDRGDGVLHFRPYNISNEGTIEMKQKKFVPLKNPQYYLKKNDIVFNNTNSPELLGKTCVITQDTNWVYSNHMTRIRLNPQFNSKFYSMFLHFLKYKGFYKTNCSNHVNQASISSGFLIKSLTIPIAPFPEQRAIVAKIERLFSELDDGTASLKKAQEQLKIYRQAVLKKAFEGNWRSTLVGEKFDFVGGGTPSKSNLNYWNGDIPWCSVKDVKNDLLYDTKDKITKVGLENSASNLAYVDEVILVTRISPGKTVIAKTKTAINQDLKIIKPKSKTIPLFVLYLFRLIERRCINLSSGTTVLGINLTNLKSIQIPDVDFQEQTQIVQEIETRLSVCDGIEANIKEALFKAKALRQSILKKAFEGKLLDDQDLEEVRRAPDWEPAENLLKRIKASKTTNRKETV